MDLLIKQNIDNLKELIIRKAGPNDLKKVCKLILGSFISETHENIKELEGSKDASEKKFYAGYLNRVNAKIPFIIYVAEKKGELIGAASGSISTMVWGYDKWGMEDYWFVKKEHRGGKAGIILFNKLIKWFKNNDAKRIMMMHYAWNPKVKDFYEKKGFKPLESSYVYKVNRGKE